MSRGAVGTGGKEGVTTKGGVRRRWSGGGARKSLHDGEAMLSRVPGIITRVQWLCGTKGRTHQQVEWRGRVRSTGIDWLSMPDS